MPNALKLLALLPLACATAAASPDAPARPAAPPADSCRPSGKVVFEIDHRAEPGAKLPTAAIKVYGNGAWTREDTDADGKAGAPRAGCLTNADAEQIEGLAGAPWKITRAQVHCMAISAQFTVYQVNGRTVFTQKLCSRESLDDKSRAKLDAATRLVERQAGKRP